MSDPTFWNSDFIKIGIPAIIAIAATIIAYKKDVRLNDSKVKHERSMLILEMDLKSIDDIANTMGGYYEAWFNVLQFQAYLTGQTASELEKAWQEVSNKWAEFSELSSIKSNANAKLHILDAKSALDVLTTQRKLYEAHWQVLQDKTVMTHEELKELGNKIGAHRNDFYRSLRKGRKQLEKNA